MNIEADFSKRLKSARIMAGWSMDVLCDKMEHIVSKQSISKYENGKMMPDSSVLLALADTLGVDPDYFFRPFPFEMEHFGNPSVNPVASKDIRSRLSSLLLELGFVA